MRIAITGAAGFVGCNLARRLIKDGHEVIGIDNFSHGSRNNIGGLDMEFIEADLTDDDCLKGLQFDLCVHLASEKIPRYSDAFFTLENNHEMLSNVIYACLWNDAKLLFASTSDVYGKNNLIPYTEDSDMVLGPSTVKRWAYAASKIHAEQYIQACASHYGLKYVIMRFFSSYGPYQNCTWWGGPQGLFIDKMIKGEAIDIHGDGLQTRSFTYIDDTVEGIVLCMRAENDIFNIGNPEGEITILGLAGVISALLNKPPIIKRIPYETFGKYEDVRFRVPDISKASLKLGFHPEIGLIEGLKRTIEWQRSVSSL